MRLLALPVLALTLAGAGAAAPSQGPSSPSRFARSAEVTRSAGTARFVVTYSSDFSLSGRVDLGNDAGVLDRGEIDGLDGVYQPISKRAAELLGIPGKRWVSRGGGHLSLFDDPFLPNTEAFFDLLGRADGVQFRGRAEEKSTPVQLYSGTLGIDAFLAVNASTIEEQQTKYGKPEMVPMRDYFDNYFPWAEGGQPLQLAVDAKGRIRRAELALPGDEVSIQFYDYGVPVDVQPPPANQILPSSTYEKLLSDFCSDPSRQTQPRPYPCG